MLLAFASRLLPLPAAPAGAAAATAGDLLPHLTNANTARDMDRIRAALGESKASYLGYSYGTYLGAVYVSLFPQRTALIVAATGDPRTPYDHARGLHEAMSGSRLVTLEARIHGPYGAYGNSCVDDSVNEYLDTGRLPGTDRTC